ncbi:MAG TPA: hypothetical protein VJQ54_06165 [Candidatus Sulfotelmatobacter sp.]|nr:hypothetical protein [Candidatus Sulfotelmatobacter sp.]
MLTNAIDSKQHQIFKKRIARRNADLESTPPRTNPARLEAALSDLYHLLEEYSPSWYTEEHRRKAAVALGKEFLVS